MATEWFISGNPKKYDCINAFRDLHKIDWKQSTNVEAGDIVYIYVSGEEHAVRLKCKANKVNIEVPDIDDRKYDLTGEFDGTAGRYMELELIEELAGDLYDRFSMEKHGFGIPQSPVRVNLDTREYLNIAQELQHATEMDPDKHDGSYELARETVRAYKNMDNLDQIDFKDMNLIYHMVIGTWRQKVDIKKKSISESHLPDSEKSRLTGLLDTIWERAKNNTYSNHEGDASIGMFGTAFYSFYDAKKEDCIRFIQMCIDILDNDSDEEMFDICQKAFATVIPGMQAASASVILHCLKPYTFPVFNSNSGNHNIYLYFGIDLEKASDVGKYIGNCRKVKAFRDKNFTVKNYRIFDLEARKLGKGEKEYDAIDFERIVAFLRDYAGKHYVNPDKTGSDKEAMEAFKEEGGKAREEYTKFCAHVVSAFPDLEAQSCSGWINQGNNTQRYFWVELKKKDWKNYPHSISISLNDKSLTDEEWVLSVRVETRDGASKEEDYSRHNVIADMAIPEGVDAYYAYTNKQGDYLLAEGGQQEVQELRDSGKARKIQVIKRISKPYDYTRTTEIVKETQDAVKFLLPFYKYIFEQAGVLGGAAEYWPSAEEYPVNLTKDDWKRFIDEVESKSHDGCMRVLACYVDIGGIGSPKTLSDKYKGHPTVYTSSILNTSKRALNFFGMDPCPDGDTQRYFPIAFQGRIGSEVNAGTYEYKMRPELLEALKEMDLTGIDLMYDKGGDDEMSETEFDKNIILYGPPGTGKTYNTAIYAVAICDKLSLDEVKARPYEEVLDRYRVLKDEEKRVAFTTFHQSYGYEEFIEGIKPKMDSDAFDVEYTIKDGVFKDFCDRASKKKTSSSGVNVGENVRVWNVILGGNDDPDLKQRCFNEGTIRIGWHKSPEVITDETEGLNDKERRILLNFQDEMEIGDVVVARATSEAVDGVAIITGGVEFDTSDEHYPRKRKVQWLYKGANISIIDLNGGTRLDRKSVYPLNRISVGDLLSRVPTESGLEVEDETRPFVFIIDEINRGNISKVFGELITLIEPTKRKGAKEAMEATLPYSNVPFGVPNNVYLIGTMNTADRSIAIMDTALRRRFQFEEMMPSPQVLRNIGADKVIEGDVELDVAEMLEVINKRIEYLFDREHTIGHAFFTSLKDEPTVQKLASIFKKSVIPLLQEYFYEDYSKIRMVLGDNGKENTEHMFILANEIKSNQIFKGDTSDVDIPDYSYVIQDEAFDNILSYKEIIG